MLTGALKSLFAVVENYPDLKANQNVMSLQEELTATENKIAFARQFYNDSVLTYNNAIQMFPTNILAGMFNFTARQFFDAPGGRDGRPQGRPALRPPRSRGGRGRSMYEQIRRNRRASWLLMAVVVRSCTGLGYVIGLAYTGTNEGGLGFLGLFGVIAIVWSLVGYYSRRQDGARGQRRAPDRRTPKSRSSGTWSRR